MLEKINNLKTWQAALVILVVGLAVYGGGLANLFQGDDVSQIVQSVPVHSITNIRVFFEGGTFYNGEGLAPLSGVYFRPLMMTVFSLIYTLFGAHTIAFHLVQLALGIGSTVLLYLFFKYSFKSGLALLLALIFLVHPINSQTIYAIPSMQDALMFFFGILALYLLVRFKSLKSLFAVAACLLLSLFAKETGVLFVALSLMCVFWYERKRLYPFLAIIAPTLILYLLLKTHAVGLFGANPGNAPIDNLSMASRLLTSPSIALFYVEKLLFPWKLASAYYWVYPTFSIRHVLLPLIIDVGLFALVVWCGAWLHKHATKAVFTAYLFFTLWAMLGLVIHLQIVPLDFTASEPWFYFSTAGVLGMIGIAMNEFSKKYKIDMSVMLVCGAALVVLLGVRTSVRGRDWSSQYNLAKHDIVASKEDYVAENEIADHYYAQGDFEQSKLHAAKSVAIFPYVINYNTLGESQFSLGDYPGAYAAFTEGLKHKPYVPLYENLGALMLIYGNVNTNKHFMMSMLQKFPQDSKIWMFLAILEDANGDNADAQVAISNAAKYGQVPDFIYQNIMYNRPFYIDIANTRVSIK